MTIRDAQTFEDHVGPGTLGIYVQFMTPTTKTRIFKYLLMCAQRSAAKRETVTVVTNDPTVQSIATRLGMTTATEWTSCDRIYVFKVDNEVPSDYLDNILRTIECPYDEVTIDYTPPNTRRLIDPTRIKVTEQEDPDMGSNPFIKPLVRDFPLPYPIPPHKPTPMFVQRIVSSNTVHELSASLLSKYKLFDLVLKQDGTESLTVDSIAFDPSDRGKGYGTAVLNDIKDYCRKHKISVLRLTASPSAKGFYLKNGFVPDKSIKGRTDYLFKF